MIQNHVQFYGLPNEDPNQHIANFLEYCDTVKMNGVSNDAIRLRLFSFSLRIRRRHGCSRNRQELLPLGKSYPRLSYTSTFHRRELHNSRTKSSGFNKWTGKHSMRPGNATRTCCVSAQITSYRSGFKCRRFTTVRYPQPKKPLMLLAEVR